MGQRSKIIKKSYLHHENDIPLNMQLLNPNSWYSKLVNTLINELIVQKIIHEKIDIEILKKIIQADTEARNEIMLEQAKNEERNEQRVNESIAASALAQHQAAAAQHHPVETALTVAMMTDTLHQTKSETLELIKISDGELARMNPAQLENHKQTILHNIHEMMNLQFNIAFTESSVDGTERLYRLEDGTTIPMPPLLPPLTAASLEKLQVINPELIRNMQAHPQEASRHLATHQMKLCPTLNTAGYLRDYFKEEHGISLSVIEFMKVIKQCDNSLMTVIKIPVEFAEEALDHVSKILGLQLNQLKPELSADASLSKPPAIFGKTEHEAMDESTIEENVKHHYRNSRS